MSKYEKDKSWNERFNEAMERLQNTVPHNPQGVVDPAVLINDACDIIEKQKGVIDEMMTCISMGRKGCYGDHYVYVMQISEKTVGLWREALGPTE